MIHSLRVRVVLLVTLSALTMGGYWLFTDPLPQPTAYHNFADQRPMVGVPHALNVLSNWPFVVVGVLGLAYMASPRSHRAGTFVDPIERMPYWVYFVGLVLTGFGSAYYHANPN